MDRFWMILIGGLIPALTFGLAAIFQKASLIQGVGVGTYVFYVGVVSVVAGLAMRLVFGETGWSTGGMAFAMLAGSGIVIGIAGVGFAVQRMGAPISLLIPIHVLSTLVTVIGGIFIFREFGGTAALRLVVGAVLVMAGAALVATS